MAEKRHYGEVQCKKACDFEDSVINDLRNLNVNEILIKYITKFVEEYKYDGDFEDISMLECYILHLYELCNDFHTPNNKEEREKLTSFINSASEIITGLKGKNVEFDKKYII